jgi:hypothetical protein
MIEAFKITTYKRNKNFEKGVERLGGVVQKKRLLEVQ